MLEFYNIPIYLQVIYSDSLFIVDIFNNQKLLKKLLNENIIWIIFSLEIIFKKVFDIIFENWTLKKFFKKKLYFKKKTKNQKNQK